jgi:hypothetical protein
MTKAQSTVIWLGLVLVTLNLIIHIGEIKSVIFGGTSATSTPASTPAQNPGSNATPTPAPNPSPTPTAVMVT